MIQRNLIITGLGLAMVSIATAQDNSGTASADCPGEDHGPGYLSYQEPYFPHSAAAFCLAGEVKVRYTIDREGQSRDIEIIESFPGTVFDRSTVDAVEQWQFTPACKDGMRTSYNVVQTIEFRLPESERQHCPDDLDRFDDETARLMSEVGARYALLFEHANEGELNSATAEAIVSPLDDFDGDLAQVARFHRKALELMVALEPQDDIVDLFHTTYTALTPSSLEDANGLERASELLAQYRSVVEAQLEQVRRVHIGTATAYRDLERDTKLDPEIMVLLVWTFVGDPLVSFDETVRPFLEPLAYMQRIADFLEERRGEWSIVENNIRFDLVDDEITWKALWEELRERSVAAESLRTSVLRSFEDYSD